MLKNDNKLQEKIDGFLRRKEAQYPDLAQQSSRERIARDTYKPGKIVHWALGISR
ncbi:MAG TPA: hypothetical protein VFM05_14970 [Candidatus Saccharimonadales bacterium]|nr:hypothetical protein [Candidatus Saccharimonadales bacterium]